MIVSRSPQKWTPEAEAELMRLREEEQLPFAEIAARLGRNSISATEARYRKIRDARNGR